MVYIYFAALFHTFPSSIEWRVRAFLSPGIGSATMLLVGYGAFAITAPVACYFFMDRSDRTLEERVVNSLA